MKTKTATVIHIMAALASGLTSAINLSEWVRVGILRRTGGYPFGGEGPVPYYYKTAELYSLVNCLFGAIFLSLTVLVLWAIFKKREKIGRLVSWCILATMVIMYINGEIAP